MTHIKEYSMNQIKTLPTETLKEYQRNLLNVKYPTETQNDKLIEIEWYLNRGHKTNTEA